MAWTKFFKPVNSVLPDQTQGVSSNYGMSAVSKFSSWLPEFYAGPPNRLMRYMQYEQMDMDHEIAAALDTIADFSTHLDEDNKIPFELVYHEDPTPSEQEVLMGSLKQWSKINKFPKRMFRIFRSTLLYGDQFFIRDPETFKLHWVDPSTVDKVLVNESEGKKIEVYYVRELDLNLQELTASNTHRKGVGGYGSADTIFPNAPYTGQANYATGTATPGMSTQGQQYSNAEAFPVDAQHVVQLSLTEGMNNSWPFGISVLEPIFKVYKQKELLEDSVLIYRVHRAPERRVFMIDVGTMPPNKAAQYLERIRYEVQQKRIPSRDGGGNSIIDSSYNPMSMLEDYFFAQTADGRGSKVDTLPAGENLGQIDDLRYFNNKMMRGLGVPSGYLPTGPEDGSATVNDGRVGQAFIQEFRFTRVCKRHQKLMVETFDREFKRFLKHRGVTVDSSIFELEFLEPQNFSDYREIEVLAARLNNYNSVKDDDKLSHRFKLRKFLGLTEDEMAENERLWKEENAYNSGAPEPSEGGAELRSVGVGAPGGDMEFGDEDFEDEGAEGEEGAEADVGADEGSEEPEVQL